MIHRYPFVIFYLLMLCRPLWGQPDFIWPVDMANVDTLSGNLGEPRPDNIENPTIHLDHWHKGIDIPKTNGENIRIPAAGKITFISEEDSSIVVLHHGIDGAHVGWHTRFLHVDFNDSWREGDILRPSSDGTMPVLGTVTKGHCHLEVYQFDTEQNGLSLYSNLGYVRNPFNHANLGNDFPDNDDPTVAEIRFSFSNRWYENWYENHLDNALETVDGQERFLLPVEGQEYPDIYFWLTPTTTVRVLEPPVPIPSSSPYVNKTACGIRYIVSSINSMAYKMLMEPTCS